MGYVRRGGGPHELEPVQIVADTIEQPLTTAEQCRHEERLTPSLVEVANQVNVAGPARGHS